MAVDTTPPIQSLIREFDRRARRRQVEAYLFLFLMLAGIGAAALVFIYAKAITDTETTPGITSRTAFLKQKLSEDNLTLREKIKDLGDAYSNLLHELPVTAKESCNTIRGTSWDFDDADPFLNDEGQLRSKREVIQKILAYRGPPLQTEPDCLVVKIPYKIGETLIFNIKQLEQVSTENWNNKDLFSKKSDVNKLMHDVGIDNGAIRQLSNIREQQEIALLTGKPHRGPPMTLGVSLRLAC